MKTFITLIVLCSMLGACAQTQPRPRDISDDAADAVHEAARQIINTP